MILTLAMIATLASEWIPSPLPDAPGPSVPRPASSYYPAPPTGALIEGRFEAAESPSALVARYYPDRAFRMEREADVTLRCRIAADGAPVDCGLLKPPVETEMNFEEAAFRMVRVMRFKPAATPMPADAVADFTVRFRLPSE